MSRTRKTAISLLALLALPAADAQASTGGALAPAATPALHALAKRARVHASGIATWFGPGFYGRLTACGQRLTPATIGVAHRSLPCGTLVQVTHAGRSIVVPVIDRGPYSHAEWDLTGGAARALGVDETVRIAAAVVGTLPNTPALGQPQPLPGAPTVAPAALAGGTAATR